MLRRALTTSALRMKVINLITFFNVRSTRVVKKNRLEFLQVNEVRKEGILERYLLDRSRCIDIIICDLFLFVLMFGTNNVIKLGTSYDKIDSTFVSV